MQNNRDVKRRLEDSGYTPTRLAIKLECNPSAIYGVLRGKLQSQKIKKSLEEYIHAPIEEIQTAWKVKAK